ncbi:MAG: hypothetical protein U5O12_15325 [Rhodoferax sp.]|nr:hypothetical protein [Rhodoferax sp.]
MRAPSGGRLAPSPCPQGSAVQANVTPLVSRPRFHPINVGFNCPQSQLQSLVAGLPDAGVYVRARLPDAETGLEGRLVFVDSALDAATGTVKARARF